MKKILLSISIIGISLTLNGQDTIIFQPDAQTGKDAIICSYYHNSNFGYEISYRADSWTYGGIPGIRRGLLDFDLSVLPSNVTILKAELSLYHSTNWNNEGDNTCILQRIVTDWDEYTVTWDNQPLTTVYHQVTLPTSTSYQQDYLNIDVTTLVRDMYNNPNHSFGLLIRLITEEPYRRLAFASSDNEEASLHPKLRIVYGHNIKRITSQPDSKFGKDAIICSYYNNSNFGAEISYRADSWTYYGVPGIRRGLMDFPLMPIPASAHILKAELSLFHSSNWNDEGDNSCTLQRIIEPWEEFTVTWNNQPSTTTVNQVYLPNSSSFKQDYECIDITPIIRDIYDNRPSSFGFMIRLKTEEPYRRLAFASSDNSIDTLHPKLVIYYISNLRHEHESKLKEQNVFVYPNPVHQMITVQCDEYLSGNACLIMYNESGDMVDDFTIKDPLTHLDLSRFPNGIYLLEITGPAMNISKKIIKY